ncbi:MAG: tetratricopeptide repeat protein, partial [Nanoarchaeota archaeon]|nr:tetratricopeptide repeat protein [Nanoarchaeota archaeon]
MNLEDKLIGKLHSAQEIDEEELLIVLGASEDKIPEYKTKLDLLEAEFEVYMEANDIPYHDAKKLALGLRDFLWKDKKNRSTRDFLLPDVIDTELANKEEKVRHCVGSTAKYWVLGSRFGLKQSVLLSPSHIYSRVILDDKSTRTLLDLENTRASGKINFDNYFDTKEFGIEGLLVATLLNRADQKNKEGNFLGALDDYNQAAKFEALKDESFYNKAILKYTHGYYEDALEDINKALELNYNWINNSNFHYNKGLILLELKKSEEALECFEKAIGINNQEFE